MSANVVRRCPGWLRRAVHAAAISRGVVNSLVDGRSRLITCSRVAAPFGSFAIRRRSSVTRGDGAPGGAICIANQYMS